MKHPLISYIDETIVVSPDAATRAVRALDAAHRTLPDSAPATEVLHYAVAGLIATLRTEAKSGNFAATHNLARINELVGDAGMWAEIPKVTVL